MATLQAGSLYVLLDLRSAELSDTTFHWALYFHRSNGPRTMGYKYHIKTLGDGWIAEHAPMSGVLKSFLLICLVRVARDIGSERWQEMESLIKLQDGQVNDGAITCRIWAMDALERLKDAGLMHCADMLQLEEELKSVGNSHREGAVNNQQRRPIVDSSFSY